MSTKRWQLSEYNGHSGTLYYDLLDDEGMRTIDCWIVEFDDKALGHVYQFVQTIDWKSTENRLPMRQTLDEAKEDAAMFFAKRELERHE